MQTPKEVLNRLLREQDKLEGIAAVALRRRKRKLYLVCYIGGFKGSVPLSSLRTISSVLRAIGHSLWRLNRK